MRLETMVDSGQGLRNKLEKLLSGWEKLAIIGVGNELNGDDGAGILAAKMLRGTLKRNQGIQVITAGTMPENFTGLLRRSRPSHVLLIDAADTGKAPGTVDIIDAGSIKESAPGTHTIPLSVLAGYLKEEMGSEVTILGIQPDNLSYGKEVSEKVKDSVTQLVDLLVQVIESGKTKKK